VQAVCEADDAALSTSLRAVLTCRMALTLHHVAPPPDERQCDAEGTGGRVARSHDVFTKLAHLKIARL
jgi:hypothetical protein